MTKTKISQEDLDILVCDSFNIKYKEMWDNQTYIPKYLMRHLPSGYFYLFQREVIVNVVKRAE